MCSPSDESDSDSEEAAADALFAQLPGFDVIDGELMPRPRKAAR